MKLVLIPKGKFMMGSPPDELNSEEDERLHEVTISHDYYLGITEVTQAQYFKVMGKNPSRFKGDNVSLTKIHPVTGRVIEEVDTSNYPVEQVPWVNAVEFCYRLSQLPEEKKAGRVYRLPTEAEWEYACRAGTKSAYYFGSDHEQLSKYAWFVKNSGVKELDSKSLLSKLNEGLIDEDKYGEMLIKNRNSSQEVAKKAANSWGLFDMLGNVGNEHQKLTHPEHLKMTRPGC